MIFLTTGEKVRSLRKKLGMRQQELEDANITRAFISMIETGKRGLSRETAKALAEKINSKAVKLGLKISIDEEFFLRTPEEDAELYCSEKLNNDPTNDEIDVILDICKRYNLIKTQARSYMVLGDYAFEVEDYKKAFINYMMSLDLYKDTDDKSALAYLYNTLGVCKWSGGVYYEALALFERANYYSVFLNDVKLEKYSLYNIARTYKALNKYEDALVYADKFLSLCNKADENKGFIAANILKAGCYIEKGIKEKAVFIYTELLKEFQSTNDESLWKVYNDLGVIYAEENNYHRSKEYFTKAEKIGVEKNRKNLSFTFIERASVCIKQGGYEEALNFANKGLKLAVELNDTDTIVKAYYQLEEIYRSLEDFNNMKNTYIKLLDIIKDKENYKQDSFKIYNKLALLYLEQNDIEMCKKYLSIVS